MLRSFAVQTIKEVEAMKSIWRQLLNRVGLSLCFSLTLAALPAAAQDLKAVTVAQGLASPWGLAFLPGGRFLVTERLGRLRIIEPDGKLSAPLEGLPAISVAGQCGLLDVVLDPQFAVNQRIFFTFAEPAASGQSGQSSNSTAVGRARLLSDKPSGDKPSGDKPSADKPSGDKLVEVRTIFSQQPKVVSNLHCGSRIVFARDGTLWVGLGDRFSRKEDAQDLTNHLGKIVRIDADGKAPADNPFVKTPGAAPEVFSLGHRNIQGMALHPATGDLWESEHGPQGGDEINVISAGLNYGWPVITHGRNYGSGTPIGEEGPKAGFEPALKLWVPTSVAPSGLAFVTSDRYPLWKGQLVMGTLREQTLIRLKLDGRKVVEEFRMNTGLKERIRDVRQGPDGWLYALTDGAQGRLVRLELP